MTVARIARGALGTLVVGVLAGYVLAGFAVPLLVESSLFGGTGESREARQFGGGIFAIGRTGQRNERPNWMAKMLLELLLRADHFFTPGRGVIQRALESQTATTTSSAFRPVSLTFIGGRSIGPYTINAYALELRPARGADRFFPLVLTLVDGKVVRRD